MKKAVIPAKAGITCIKPKKVLLVLVMLLFSIITINAQQTWQWGRNGGGSMPTGSGSGDNDILDMKSDMHGNMFILALVTNTNARFMGDTFVVYGSNDLLLYKIDCNGNKIWKKQIGDTGGDDGTFNPALQIDQNENVYVIGYAYIISTHGFRVDTDTLFTPTIGRYFSSYIVKYDKDGNYKSFKTNETFAVTNFITYLTSYMGDDNNLYILTMTRGNILSLSDTINLHFNLLKYNSNLILQSIHGVTDSGVINTWSITGDEKGNLCLAGYTSYVGPSSKITILGGHQVGPSKTFVCKFDTSGVLKWIKLNDDYQTAIRAITYNKNNGLIYACGSGGAYNTPGDTGTRYGSFHLLNPITFLGFKRGGAPIVISFDTSGNVVSGNIVGMHYVSTAYAIDVSNIDHVVIGGIAVGHTSIGGDTFNPNGQDAFYAELNSSLQFIGGTTLNGDGFYDAITQVAYDERGNIYVGGYMASTMNLPGDTLYRTGGGLSDLFIAKYGVPVCTCPYAVSGFNDAFVSNLNYTYTSSALNADSIWWDFGDGNTQSGGTTANHTYATAGNYIVCQHVSNDCSLDEYCKSVSVVLGINDVKESFTAIIYPNPATTSIHIHIQDGDLPANSEYVLFDMSGREVLSGKITGNDTSVMLPNAISNGVYLLQVNDENGSMLMSKRIEIIQE